MSAGKLTIEQMRQQTSVAVVTGDQLGLITFVNQCFEELFGWTAKEIVGKPLTTIIPDSLHSAHHLGFSRFLVTKQPTLLNKPLKLRAVLKDGRELDFEHFITAEEREGEWTFGATLRPLSTLTS